MDHNSELFEITHSNEKPVRLHAWTFREAAQRWANDHGKVGIAKVKVLHVDTGDHRHIEVVGKRENKISFEVKFSAEHGAPRLAS